MRAAATLLCVTSLLPAVGLAYQANVAQQCVSPTGATTAQEVIDELGLIPNVEKGYFVESFRDTASIGNRSLSTAIYYLLEGSEGKSFWHRVDAPEVWHYYAGAPLSLFLSKDDGQAVRERVLGPEILSGQRPQVVVAKQEWQQAQSHGDWTLVGTTVAPGFIEGGFELAPPGWQPKGAR